MVLCFLCSFKTLTEDTVIFNSAGCDQVAIGSGVTIFYRNERLGFRVSTQTFRYTSLITRVSTNRYYTYTMTWSKQLGLAVYVDGELEKTRKLPVDRHVILDDPTNCELVIGQVGNPVTTFYLELLHIVYLHKDSIDSVGITTG